MKKNMLKTLGIMILSITVLASAMTGCGNKEADSMQVTEQVEVSETETEESETETEEPEMETETEEAVEETETEEAAFTVTEMSATKYAKSAVNVRKGPSADYEKLGGLSANQKVTVTGQADTGWYRIEYNGAEGYVSDKYLTDQKQTGNAASGFAAGNASNAASTGNINGTSSISDNTGSSAGSTDNTSAVGSTDTSSSASNAGSTDTSGSANTGSGTGTPSADTGSTNTSGSADTGSTDTSGSTDVGNSGDTTPPAGSVIDPNTGMTIPDDVVIEDWSDMQGGADDGTGLGGTWEWN